jgi:hypothetical protein
MSMLYCILSRKRMCWTGTYRKKYLVENNAYTNSKTRFDPYRYNNKTIVNTILEIMISYSGIKTKKYIILYFVSKFMQVEIPTKYTF